MDDPRFEWIRDRVYDGFNLYNPAIFDLFLEDNESDLSIFLNKGPQDCDSPVAILFYIEKVCNIPDEKTETTVDESEQSPRAGSQNELNDSESRASKEKLASFTTPEVREPGTEEPPQQTVPEITIEPRDDKPMGKPVSLQGSRFVPLFIWFLSIDLSDVGDLTSSRATVGISLGVIGTSQTLNHFKVETQQRGFSINDCSSI